jgi:hypothetical protein
MTQSSCCTVRIARVASQGSSSLSAMGLGLDDDNMGDVVQVLVMTMVLAGGVYQWCRWSWVAVRRLAHGGVTHMTK